MDENPELKGNEPTPTQASKWINLGWPGTRLGRVAVVVTVVSWLLPLSTLFINVILNSLSSGEPQALSLFNGLVLLGEIAGGIIGAIAVWKKNERSLLVWLVILLGVGAVVLAASDIILAL